MSPEDVQKRITDALTDCQVTVTGDGSHFEAVVIGAVFEGMMPVKKQQLVYATINDLITSGELHAMTIKTYTPEEWDKAQKLKVS